MLSGGREGHPGGRGGLGSHVSHRVPPSSPGNSRILLSEAGQPWPRAVPAAGPDVCGLVVLRVPWTPQHWTRAHLLYLKLAAWGRVPCAFTMGTELALEQRGWRATDGGQVGPRMAPCALRRHPPSSVWGFRVGLRSGATFDPTPRHLIASPASSSGLKGLWRSISHSFLGSFWSIPAPGTQRSRLRDRPFPVWLFLHLFSTIVCYGMNDCVPRFLCWRHNGVGTLGGD